MTHIVQATGIIRQRGQLTIPDEMRNDSEWLSPDSVVTIKKSKPRRLIIEPYSSPKKDVDWDKLWKDLKRVRSFKGRGKVGSLSEFIVKDRENHF